MQARVSSSARGTAQQWLSDHERSSKLSFSHSPGSGLRKEETFLPAGKDREPQGQQPRRCSSGRVPFLLLPEPAAYSRSAPRTVRPPDTLENLGHLTH